MALNIKQRQARDVVFADDLTIEWRDGVVSHYPFFALRDSCPCAECIDEMSGKKVLDPNSIQQDIHIRSADYVGRYALRFDWSDGHDSGIYSFRFLREMFDTAMEEGATPEGPHSTES